MTATKPRRGRPPGDPALRRTYTLQVLLSEAERAEVEAWAERSNQPVSVAVRERVLRAARRS